MPDNEVGEMMVTFHQLDTSRALTAAFREVRDSQEPKSELLNRVQRVWVESLETGAYRLKDFGGTSLFVGRLELEKLEWLREMQSAMDEPLTELWQEIAVSLIPKESQTQIAMGMELQVSRAIMENYNPKSPSPEIQEVFRRYGVVDLIQGTGKPGRASIWFIFRGEDQRSNLKPAMEALKKLYFYPTWFGTLRWLRKLRAEVERRLDGFDSKSPDQIAGSLTEEERTELSSRMMLQRGYVQYALGRLSTSKAEEGWGRLRAALRIAYPDGWT